ncbi:Ff.00g035030.m01.CDS01 [Fusarium sp. VM40]|nr:Ff.00g035030.m01.CDS01 [Fusarium sp. VM40]
MTYPSAKHSVFLALPGEIRRQIYELCIPINSRIVICQDSRYQVLQDGDGFQPKQETYDTEDDNDEIPEEFSSDIPKTDGRDFPEPPVLQDVKKSASRRTALPEILLVCRQITDELKPVLYGSTTFTVIISGGEEKYLEKLFSLETREHFRKMILIFRTEDLSSDVDLYLNPKIWDRIFSNLLKLGIIIEQPEPWDGNWVLDEWKARLTSTLGYLNRAIPDKTKIIADANEEAEATQIVERMMPERCDFQKLLDGDLVLDRYWNGNDDDWPTSCRDCIDDGDYDFYYSD